MKKLLITLLKVVVAGGLIAWLVYAGKLDFGSLRIFADRADVLTMQIVSYVVCAIGLGVLRWTILMRALDLEVTYWRGIQLQMIGFFFNTAVPGAVGGDLVKAIYVMREQKTQRKTPALLTVVLDRVIGVAALFIMAGAAVLLNWSFVREHRQVWPLATLALSGLAGLIVATGAVFFPFRDGRDPFLKLLSHPWPGFGALKSAYEAMRSYRSRPWVLISCVLISLVIQSINAYYTMYVSEVLTGFHPDTLTFAMIYPLAILTTAIPLAPGGMGVGHVAFDSFYHLVGWSGGANVFNVIVLATLAFNLLGVVPYLFFRSRAPQPAGDDLEALLATRS